MGSKFLKVVAISLAALFMPGIAMAASKPAKRASIKHTAIDLRGNNRVVFIKGPIRSGLADKIVSQVSTLSDTSNEPIVYLINTFGGSLMAGNQIIRAMKGSRAPSVCIVESSAFSMGALILAQCDEAYIHKDASVLFHEGYMGAQGRVSEVISYIEFEKKEFDRLTMQTAAFLHMDLDTYKAKQKDEFWLTAEETVRLGLALAIVDRMDYKAPERERFNILDLLGGGESLDKADFFDLTYYPKGNNNPYLPMQNFRTLQDEINKQCPKDNSLD